ncbi:transposase [Candidatus Enterovibrio escicola]|uniref:transposase n=1 Tax=Candidatus Enterovibrio escicola TaxID=1927127 RepID=UPI0011BAD6EC
MEIEFPTRPYVIRTLWVNYPDGFYAHPSNGRKNKIPSKSYLGLIRYLTKYLSSPPISLSKIVRYDGHQIRYYYQSHKTKLKTYEREWMFRDWLAG